MALRIKREDEPDEQASSDDNEISLADNSDSAIPVEAEVIEDNIQVESPDPETRVGSVDLIDYLPRVPQDVREGFRDFTDKEWSLCLEDYQRGFAPMTGQDWEKYQVPEEPAIYRTREKLSRNCVKVSAGLVGKWVQAKTNKSRPFYPDGYLQDEFGFTPQAVAVFRNMMRYTCKRRFKTNEQGVIEWDKLERDLSPIKDPLYSEENPDYVLCSLYWQKVEQMWLDYCDLMDWISEYRQRISIETSFQGEELPNRESNDARSEFRAREELAKHQIRQYWAYQLNALKEEMVEMARDTAMETVAEGYEAAAEVFKGAQPAPVEEQDLWSEG